MVRGNISRGVNDASRVPEPMCAKLGLYSVARYPRLKSDCCIPGQECRFNILLMCQGSDSLPEATAEKICLP